MISSTGKNPHGKGGPCVTCNVVLHLFQVLLDTQDCLRSVGQQHGQQHPIYRLVCAFLRYSYSSPRPCLPQRSLLPSHFCQTLPCFSLSLSGNFLQLVNSSLVGADVGLTYCEWVWWFPLSGSAPRTRLIGSLGCLPNINS